MTLKLNVSLFLAGVVLASGCQDRDKGPEVASSAEQPGYALRYPSEVEGTQKRIDTQAQAVNETSGKLLAFPADLKDPDWKLVESVYSAADEEGRGQAYAQRYDEAVVVRGFFEQEKKPIIGRVAGGVQHAAKEKGHDFEAYGAVSFSLERAVDKQLSERARADSSAHRLIEEHAQALGKKNVETLQEQADQLTFASHIVNVRLAEDERRLRDLVEESSSVRATLEEHKEELQKKEKPDADAIQRVDEALSQLDKQEKDAKTALEGAQERADKLKKQYEKDFDELIDQVQKQAEAQGDE